MLRDDPYLKVKLVMLGRRGGSGGRVSIPLAIYRLQKELKQ